jgi:hypothetical protein
MIQTLILINLSIVFLIDQSGFINEFKSWLKKLLTNGKMKDSNYSLKPFDCSLCMTFWVSLIYLLIINELTIESFALVCLSAWLTTFTNDIYIVVKEMWTKLINKIL